LKQQLLRDKVLDFVLARADVGSAAAAGGAPDTEGEAAPASDTTAQTEEQP
jgi:ribosomal protein L12E/L44/L45/RPP1/RPP2